jgi:hypothetical protein
LAVNTNVYVNYTSILANFEQLSLNTNTLSWLGNMAKVCRSVYEYGEDVNAQDHHTGDTPLHRTCYTNDSDIASVLLLAEADETITNDRGQTPVQLAVEYNSVEVLPLLDVSSKWKFLVRSHRLRRRTAVRVMMTLVKWKVQQSKLLPSKLLQAAREGRIDDVSQLSKHFAADVDMLSRALNWACEYVQINVVTWLVEHTVLRDDGVRLGGALVRACCEGQLNVVTWLVEHTVLRDDVEAVEFWTESACCEGQLNVVTWLVEHTVLRDDGEALSVGLTSGLIVMVS